MRSDNYSFAGNLSLGEAPNMTPLAEWIDTWIP